MRMKVVSVALLRVSGWVVGKGGEGQLLDEVAGSEESCGETDCGAIERADEDLGVFVEGFCYLDIVCCDYYIASYWSATHRGTG